MEILFQLLTLFCTSTLGQWLNTHTDAASNDLLGTVTTYFEQAVTDVCNPAFMGAITGITIPIGILIMSIYFLVDLISKSMTANFNVEILIRSFIKFIIGYALINNCDKIAGGLIQFGDVLTSDVAAKIGGLNYSFSSNAQKILNYITSSPMLFLKYGYAVIFRLIIKCMAETFITWLYKAMIMMVAYSRAIKIFVYRAFLPIAIADIFGKGIYAGATRHIKRLLALAMQYPMVYIICVLSCIFLGQMDFLHTNWVSMLGQMAMVGIVVVNTIKKSTNEAMQIFG